MARSIPGRFEEYRRATRRRRVRRLGLLAAVVGTVAAGVWVVGWSGLLAARSVTVEGEQTLTVAEVRTAAAVPIGTPLARLNLRAIESRVQSLPLVESAEVSRSWPRGVTVRVTERTAVAWIQADGAIRGVDALGVVFRDFPEAPPLTKLEVVTADPRARPQALESLGAVVADLQQSAPDLLSQVAVAAAESRDSVTLKLADGRVIRWGSAERSDDKLAVITALIASVQAREYDVSAPEEPTTAS